jgi:flavin-binding protein dodecin
MPQDDQVPGGVVRVIELVGSSPNSFSDAVRNAVRLASQSLPNIRGVEVLSSNADVDDAGNLTLYKVQCKIAFLVEPAQVGQTHGWDLPTATQT